MSMYHIRTHGKRSRGLEARLQDGVHLMLQWLGWFGTSRIISNPGRTRLISYHSTLGLPQVGLNHQDGGQITWDGRILPDLDFWQMDVGLHGLKVDSPFLSGILGETARPVLSEAGQPLMEGMEAFRGKVEDYRVADPLATHFALLDEPKA